ncbi:MAG: glycosyltransferase family 4 protein [Terriglobales bacterium]
MTVASMYPKTRYKGVDTVIRALPLVRNAVPDVVYLVCGADLDRDYLAKIAAENGVSSIVMFAGAVAESDLPDAYNLCDVFVMCSREELLWRWTFAEGFGIVFLEASASGKPVVGGNTGGVPDAVKHRQTGLLVDACDVHSLASALICLLQDGELRATMGANGRRWVEQEMTWARAAQQFSTAYAELLGAV